MTCHLLHLVSTVYIAGNFGGGKFFWLIAKFWFEEF